MWPWVWKKASSARNWIDIRPIRGTKRDVGSGTSSWEPPKVRLARDERLRLARMNRTHPITAHPELRVAPAIWGSIWATMWQQRIITEYKVIDSFLCCKQVNVSVCKMESCRAAGLVRSQDSNLTPPFCNLKHFQLVLWNRSGSF